MTEVSFIVDGIAQPAGSKTAGMSKGGKMYIRDDSKKRRPWQREVVKAATAGMGGAEPLDGPLELAVLFVVPRPKGHFGARGLRPSAPPYPTVRPDVTKLMRALEDAMTKIVWRDDAQVVVQRATKVYGEPARAEVTVTALTVTPAATSTT